MSEALRAASNGVCYCNTNVSLLQSRGAIHSIPSHTTYMFSCLQVFDDLILKFYLVIIKNELDIQIKVQIHG
jgi:hypothetical protein